MKNIFLIIAIIGGIKYYMDRPSVSLQHGDVILYATDWCGYCKMTRAFFEKNDIQYIEYNIEKSVEGKRRYNQIAQGSGVPVIDIKGSVIKGYSEKELRRVLGL